MREFWAVVVAEAKKGDLPRVEVAAKHGVSDAALKYHLYKKAALTARLDIATSPSQSIAVRRSFVRKPERLC